MKEEAPGAEKAGGEATEPTPSLEGTQPVLLPREDDLFQVEGGHTSRCANIKPERPVRVAGCRLRPGEARRVDLCSLEECDELGNLTDLIVEVGCKW